MDGVTEGACPVCGQRVTGYGVTYRRRDGATVVVCEPCDYILHRKGAERKGPFPPAGTGRD